MELSVGVEFGQGESRVGCGKLDVAAGECGRETGNQENTEEAELTGMHAPFYEDEGTRIIFPKESKLGVGGNAGCSEI